MSGRDWQHYVAPDGAFELDLPPGVELELAEQPDEAYYYCSPVPEMGTFSVLCEPSPGSSPQDLLDLERRLGADVTVEANVSTERQGQAVHHLRFRTAETQPRERVEDPSTGRIYDMPEQHIEEIVDVLFWRGERKNIRVGYRVRTDAPAELEDTLDEMAQSFRLLEGTR
ncbi:MAG: hypothetical protein JXA74_04025 [Anaerolineae bacterium]|nr:hypothetical protein [Anaerolineae bacterium]